MSVSTDGIICYGMLLLDDTELPWGDYEIEEWWRTEKGYKPPFELFGEDGNYLPYIETVKDKYGQIKAANPDLATSYVAAQSEWDKANPLPVEMVNSCSSEVPVWIVAVPGTVRSVRRGHPERFEPAALAVDPQALNAAHLFCSEYGIAGEGWGWYLGSYWG